jgi:steroid delta-isomerase-like uncharacterized protein
VEANKAIVRRFFQEIWNHGNLASINELVGPTFVMHESPYQDNLLGPEGVRRAYLEQSINFPDSYYTIEDILAEGDKVAVRTIFNFTHSKMLKGQPPTGRQIAYRGMNLFRIANGKIVEEWWVYDHVGRLKQLGVSLP